MKCKHLVMKNHSNNFTDVVSGKVVYNATCKCGKTWLVDTKFPIPIFKVEKNNK